MYLYQESPEGPIQFDLRIRKGCCGYRSVQNGVVTRQSLRAMKTRVRAYIDWQLNVSPPCWQGLLEWKGLFRTAHWTVQGDGSTRSAQHVTCQSIEHYLVK